jgi:lipid-binding SYLF domain-containing protein
MNYQQNQPWPQDKKDQVVTTKETTVTKVIQVPESQNKNFQSQNFQTQNLQTQNLESQNLQSHNFPSENLHNQNDDYWYYCNHSYTTGGDNLNEKNVGQYNYNRDRKHQTKMDAIICNSCEMLKEHFDPHKNVRDIPYFLFRECKGIIFLRIWKAGIGIGGIGGTGIVMARNNGMWSAPCAVSLGGVTIGANLGIERVDDVLLLRDSTALTTLIEKGQFKLGLDASIAVGPFGKDANTSLSFSSAEASSIYSYSFAKGAFIGLSLEGGGLSVNNRVNEEFYGNKIGVKDLFYGNVPHQNENFRSLIQYLDTLATHQQTTFNQSSNIHPNVIDTKPVISQ